MKHIKLFETTLEYDAFKTSDGFVLPNVSLVKEDNTVLYETFPKPEMIEYHFDVPMHIINGMGEVVPDGTPIDKELNIINGTLNDDFSGIYNKLLVLIKENGSLIGEAALEKTNITVNGIRINDISDWGNEICLANIDLPINAFAGNLALLTADRITINFAPAAFPNYPNWKEEPDSGVIEYHWEFDNLEENYDIIGEVGLEQTINGDFKEPFNKLMSVIEEYGDGYQIDTNIVQEHTNITLNGYKVTYISYYEDRGIIELLTDGPSGMGWATYAELNADSLYFCTLQQ